MSNFRAVVPNDTDIDSVISAAYDAACYGTAYENKSYEDGVLATLEWIFGDCDLNPFEEG